MINIKFIIEKRQNIQVNEFYLCVNAATDFPTYIVYRKYIGKSISVYTFSIDEETKNLCNGCFIQVYNVLRFR